MNVAELAKDLGVPRSTILETCSRLGVDAAWAGADLGATDLVRVRADLGAAPATPAVATPQDVGAAPPPTVDADPLPPTTVTAATGGVRRVTTASPERRLDPAVRPAVVCLLLAVVFAIAANQVHGPVVVLVAWVAIALLLLGALLSAKRARYRITTHPDQRSGLRVAVAVLVVGLLAASAFGAAVWTVVRSAPADQAPLGLGGLRSVQELRWGYQRVAVIADHGWHRPAKDADSCWEAADGPDEPRRLERVEVGGRSISCEATHQFEVARVFAVDRDADSSYPGAARLRSTATASCRDLDVPAGGRLRVEYPTQAGWDAADHDVACVIEARRSAPLGG